MKTQIRHSFESRLPGDDAHPYRTGPWRPQTTEYDAWDLDVEGTIPTDLSGAYLRNTENPLLPPIQRYHPFDGDGMLHSISFAGGMTTVSVMCPTHSSIMTSTGTRYRSDRLNASMVRSNASCGDFGHREISS